MAMRQFKAESKKLLDLMINSIYTNREIFLRELISNASDACDKRYFKSLTDTSIGITKDDLKIHIQPDKENRTLTIRDNGIGMTKEELEKNLGTIAKSGSLDFKTENQSDNIDIIGQFGVGFYSAFMVASKVTVISRAQGEDTAWMWESKGVEGYTLTEADKEDVGTEIILVLKEDTDTDWTITRWPIWSKSTATIFISPLRCIGRSLVRSRNLKTPGTIISPSTKPTRSWKPSIAWCPSGNVPRAK